MQTSGPDELVVVHDDHEWPAETANALEERLKETRVRHRQILSGAVGLTRSRNIGVSLLSGDIVFFLDDDVVLMPDYIEQILRIYKADSTGQVGGVGGRSLGERPSRPSQLFGRLFCLASRRPGVMLASGSYSPPTDFRDCLEVQALSGCNMSYRRSVFDELSFDEWYGGYANGEDLDFSFRVSKRYRLVVTPFATVTHKHSETARLSSKEFAYMQLRNHSRFFAKNLPDDARHRLCFAISIIGLMAENVLRFGRRPTGSTFGFVLGTLLWLRDTFI